MLISNTHPIFSKTKLNEAASRITIRRGKMVNEHLKAWQKIVDFVVNGDLPSALIYVRSFNAQIENYINDEGKIKVYDVLNTLLD